MPIPGDNGDPRGEMDRQDERINKVCMRGANVVSELRAVAKPEPEHSIFGVMP